MFALKNEGVQLFALSRIFPHLNAHELATHIRAKPTSKYARRIFFLYELLTATRLPLEDLTQGSYCDVLERDDYFTAEGVKSRRHRVVDNLLGDGSFCPTVRRTETLKAFAAKRLGYHASKIAESVDPKLLARATRFLYTKETKSSFEIEREDPGDRMERYVEQLRDIGSLPLRTQDGLTNLQNSLVDPRFADRGYRCAGDDEIYVGQTVGYREQVHHIGVNSEETPAMMAAWARMREVTGEGGPVVEAACRSFSFVFIHPFSDGNGRIHRLLLHHVLARRGYLPGHLVVPISSVIVEDMQAYDATLEDFSTRAMHRSEVDYSLDEDGRLHLSRQRTEQFRFPDLTVQAESTFKWLARAIEVDLPRELEFLLKFDEVVREVRGVVEMPDRLERLFVRLTMQNRGRLSKKKRKHFEVLDDATIQRLEEVVCRVLEAGPTPRD